VQGKYWVLPFLFSAGMDGTGLGLLLHHESLARSDSVLVHSFLKLLFLPQITSVKIQEVGASQIVVY
jgi:hypothetical protein